MHPFDMRSQAGLSRPFRFAAALCAFTLPALLGCGNSSADVNVADADNPDVNSTDADNAGEQAKARTAFDHDLFDQVLKAHVDDDGFVDYAALHDDPTRLDAYLEKLKTAPLDKMGRDEKLATLINAYNAFTLRLILDYYPVESIKDIPEGLFTKKRWKDVRWRVGEHTWSLDQIEHEQIRPKFNEPRIHWALVCAAYSCPKLLNEAYTAERLEQQLDTQATYVHGGDPFNRYLRYRAGADDIHVTKLYDWYDGDFEQAAGSVLKYVARYVPALKRDLEKGHEPDIEYLEYDWKLNSKKNRPKE